ncbi:hypothetical protein, partial [Klebsiella variicola]|uniref:hypothetical protein n=1 Tax=Klebsiella variicola TaxID=244366 RepID=UPI001E28CBE2
PAIGPYPKFFISDKYPENTVSTCWWMECARFFWFRDFYLRRMTRTGKLFWLGNFFLFIFHWH